MLPGPLAPAGSLILRQQFRVSGTLLGRQLDTEPHGLAL